MNLALFETLPAQTFLGDFPPHRDPLSAAMVREGLAEEFPEFSELELFLEVNCHWVVLQNERETPVSATEAVLDFGSRFAGTANSRFHFQLGKRRL